MNEGATDQAGNSLQLISRVFRDGAPIPSQYSCGGQNVNPPLNIAGVPDKAKSLSLIIHDPDAAGDFVHWLVWDMPSSTESIGVNKLPIGAIQGKNGTGESNYMGPCPPSGSGVHHYKFELYALDVASLGLDQNADRQALQKSMDGHVVASQTLTGTFENK